MEIFFVDQEELCIYDGSVKKFRSKSIENYRQTAERIAKSRSWKESGDGARFRGDGNIVATNGKSIFLVAGGKTEKILFCEKCTLLTLKHEVIEGDELFEL